MQVWLKLILRLVHNTTLDDAGSSGVSVACPTQCRRSWNGTGVYSSVAYGMQHNARIDSSSIPVSLALHRKMYTLTTLGPVTYCEPAFILST